MNYNKEAKSLSFWGGSEVSQEMTGIWGFAKTRGTLFKGPYTKDSTI